MMECFKSSVKFDKEHADANMTAEAIKAHMNIMKSRPVIGKDIMGIIDGKPIPQYNLNQAMIDKLGKFKENYNSCIDALKRYSVACELYTQSEQEYGKAINNKKKLAKSQTLLDQCLHNSKQIGIVFKNLEAEYKTFMQEQTDEIPVLKSAVSDNRPLMDPLEISELSGVLCNFRKKLCDIVGNRFDLPNSSKIFGQIIKEFTDIRKTMNSFQYVKVLENIMKEINKNLLEAKNVIHRKKSIKQQSQ